MGKRGSVLECASPLARWPPRTKAVQGYRTPRRYRVIVTPQHQRQLVHALVPRRDVRVAARSSPLRRPRNGEVNKGRFVQILAARPGRGPRRAQLSGASAGTTNGLGAAGGTGGSVDERERWRPGLTPSD